MNHFSAIRKLLTRVHVSFLAVVSHFHRFWGSWAVQCNATHADSHTKRSHFLEVIHPSLHFLSPLIPHCGSQGLMESIPGVSGRSQTSRQFITVPTQWDKPSTRAFTPTHSLELPLSLVFMALENLSRRTGGRGWELHAVGPRFITEPATLLLSHWKGCFVHFCSASSFVKGNGDRK